jgi:glycosyltransferase involved in cell wall biosynthesis
VVAVGPVPPPHSGLSIAFKEVCDDLVREGYRCRVVDIALPVDTEVGWRRSAKRLRDWFRALAQLRREVSRAERPVLYLMLGQARMSVLRDLCCVLIGRAHGAVLVGHVHGGSYDLLFRDADPALRVAILTVVRSLDRIIVLGEGLRRMFDFEPSAAPRLEVVPNGLPAGGALAASPRALDPDGPLRLLFLSNLIESKGYFEVVEAAGELRRRGRDVHVHLAGEFRQSPDDLRVRSTEHAESLLRERARALGLEGAVTLHGTVEGADKERLLRECHLFVLPTRYRFEGQPISIIEALAAGLPVVATRFRAIPDLVDDRVSGVLLDEATPGALADAVEWLAAPERYGEASRAAIETARTRLRPEQFLGRVRELLVERPHTGEAAGAR